MGAGEVEISRVIGGQPMIATDGIDPVEYGFSRELHQCNRNRGEIGKEGSHAARGMTEEILANILKD